MSKKGKYRWQHKNIILAEIALHRRECGQLNLPKFNYINIIFKLILFKLEI